MQSEEEFLTMKHAKIALTTLLLSACVRGLAGDNTHSDGSDLGIMIIGTIVEKSGDNVALIKEQKTNRVRAVKRGHLLSDSSYAIGKVASDYIVLVKPGEKVFHFVHKDKFSKDDIALAAKTSAQSLADKEYYAEDGFERKRNGTESQVKMTGMYRDKIVKEDLSQILMQASAIPHMENGAIVGFKLLQIDEGSIYSKAGLKDDDVITSINGTDLTSAAGAVSLLRSLKGANKLDVEMLRGGGKESISIQVD
jgi:type II secretion system protein C